MKISSEHVPGTIFDYALILILILGVFKIVSTSIGSVSVLGVSAP